MNQLEQMGIEKGSVNWEKLFTRFKELKALKEVPQDPVYHAEGNVLVHTQMVCEMLIELEDFLKLSFEEKKIVFFAALFHDMGKRITTKEEVGT